MNTMRSFRSEATADSYARLRLNSTMQSLSLLHLLFLSAFFFSLIQVGFLLSFDDTSYTSNLLGLHQCSDRTSAACRDYDDTVTTASSRLPMSIGTTTTTTNSADLGVPQAIDTAHATAVLERLERARSYMKNTVNAVNSVNNSTRIFDNVRNKCKLTHANCTLFSIEGQCSKFETSGKMSYQCAPVCETCELVDIKVRCPMPVDTTYTDTTDGHTDGHTAGIDTLYPGDLDRKFQAIVSNPVFLQQYNLQVLSRPSYAPGDTADTLNLKYQIGPWMVLFDNIVSDKEAAVLIDMGRASDFKQSVTATTADDSDAHLHTREDGTVINQKSRGRTSTNAWCVDACGKEPTVVNVTSRMEQITGISAQNYEYLQILRYEKGQFFGLHNDFIPDQANRQPGVRILTFYVYLSDVQEGGGTNFFHLNITVTPARGRAVLWPSVLDEDPNTMDVRTNHQALPVVSGTKYGFNAWIHQRNFREPHRKGCH
jgi:prolyl 4-hydroxylase